MAITRPRVLALAMILLAAPFLAGPRNADAAYPGGDGRIAFVRFASIYTATSSGGGLKWITYGGQPRWSPDGTRIAFVRNGDVYTVAAGGGAVTRITTSPAYDQFPSWSPDGKYLIFTSYRYHALNVYELHSTAPYSTVVNLTAKIAPCGQAWNGSWGTGGFIAFFACDPATGGVDLYEMRPDGSSLKELLSPGYAGWLDWAPLGNAIAYQGPHTANGMAVYQTTLATGVTKQVSPATSQPYFFDWPAWSPSGTQIAFEGVPPTGAANIYVASPTGLNFHKIINNGQDPNWQPVVPPVGSTSAEPKPTSCKRLRHQHGVGGRPMATYVAKACDIVTSVQSEFQPLRRPHAVLLVVHCLNPGGFGFRAVRII
jgi:dipeptidyl aminopeptidase/acylaminoacyl peptidase